MLELLRIIGYIIVLVGYYVLRYQDMGMGFAIAVFGLMILSIDEFRRGNGLSGRSFLRRRRTGRIARHIGFYSGILGEDVFENDDWMNEDESVTDARRNALANASIFLGSYNNIWNNLVLSNKLCSLILKDGVIQGYDLTGSKRSFRVLNSDTSYINDLWNTFCNTFTYNHSYQELLEQCKRMNVRIKEYGNLKHQQVQENNADQAVKVDINNCSEVEMTSLPGVNIIMAKRAINKRNEIGGFKKIEDFFLYLHIKESMQKRLRDYIIVEKMKIEKTIQLNNERSVDL